MASTDNSHRRGPALSMLLAVAVLVSGCVVPDDAEPRALEPSNVPFSLLATSTTNTTQTVPSVTLADVSVYLVDNETNQLVEVSRSVPGPGNPRAALEELLDGPTEDELSVGLTSAIAQSTTLLGLTDAGNRVITVNLSDDLRTISGQGQRLALAQVVFTATATEEVDGVLFAFEGKLSEVPDAQGQSTADPLERGDFATFDPNVPSPPPAQPPPATGNG